MSRPLPYVNKIQQIGNNLFLQDDSLSSKSDQKFSRFDSNQNDQIKASIDKKQNVSRSLPKFD